METSFYERMTEFGLTRQESCIYHCLLKEGKITGYEAAKLTGISRSNTYSSLAGLTEKGAAYLAEEEASKKYVPVPLQEFCDKYIRMLKEYKSWLISNITVETRKEEGYVTIEGERHIVDKIRHVIEDAEERVYISCSRSTLSIFSKELQGLSSSGKKVVVITDEPAALKGAKVYLTGEKDCQIGVISDSSYVMTGEFGEGSLNTCLYSGQKNFVELYKRALSNEIKLIQYEEGEKN